MNGILSISAHDMETGIFDHYQRKRPSEEEIERMVVEAEEFAEQDAKKRLKFKLVNDLKPIYNLKNLINDTLKENCRRTIVDRR
jgi:molecular chaperone DnaK (HSP70)